MRTCLIMKGPLFAAILAATALGTLPALSQGAKPQVLRVAQPATLPGLGAPVDFDLRVASQPLALIQASDGTIWFAAYTLGALGRIDRATREVTYFPLGTGSRPYGLVEAPDRSILAVDRALNVLHRLAPANGEVTRIGMPADLPFLDLSSLRLDSEGRIWFSGASGWLGSHDPRTGATDVSSHEDLQGLTLSAASPTGSLWFVAGKSGRMIRIDPARSRFDSAVIPPEAQGIRSIAVSPSGEVWLSAMKSQTLVRYAGRAAWMTAKLPWPESRPQALVVRQDGTIVFADAGRRKLVRYRPGLDRFEDLADLGAGGAIKAMIDLGDGIAVADMGADRIRIYPDIPLTQN
ncbi:MAG: hypothetical protein O9308_08430 [Beijerinckiaceae bacterium]|nr:hypothetical protein [Beijerinckiaceae bacterium]